MEQAERSEVDQLWSAYKLSAARPDRDALIVHYSPLVKYVASRVASGLPQSVDVSDLVSYGIFGLIDAIEKFEPERGFKFETYAMARIKGAILDELRAIDWVPRSLRAKSRAIERAYSKLESTLHRAPTDSELATELGQSEDELARTLTKIHTAGVAALDDVVAGDRSETTTLGDTIADTDDGPAQALEADELRLQLANSIAALPEREKIVLGLYYYENMTLAEIGQVLGVTESRICQIHTKAVIHLRARMQAADRD
jgi:RNA polymerase sigma factor FliA